ncbi:MAG: hypothetical protein NZ777_10880 [Pseudomonadales bacterium]|nr:hypothetical protein [Pseudomonadales bacterium]
MKISLKIDQSKVHSEKEHVKLIYLPLGVASNSIENYPPKLYRVLPRLQCVDHVHGGDNLEDAAGLLVDEAGGPLDEAAPPRQAASPGLVMSWETRL